MPFNLSPSRGFDTSARARFTNKACRINKHSQRTFKDETTGETRYIDEFRTIDGIKSRYGPH